MFSLVFLTSNNLLIDCIDTYFWRIWSCLVFKDFLISPIGENIPRVEQVKKYLLIFISCEPFSWRTVFYIFFQQIPFPFCRSHFAAAGQLIILHIHESNCT